MPTVTPELAGLALLLLGLTLLVAEQKLFGYDASGIAEKIIIAIINYGLLLIAVSYGLRVA